MNKTLIIAEAGVNHNGDINLAKKLVDIASEAGADYVKFQTFKAEKLVAKSAKKAEYQQRNMGGGEDTQFSMLKKLELTDEDHQQLISYCQTKNIKFLSTAFDLDSTDFLSQLGIDLFKVPSGELTNYPYLKKIGATGKKVVLSTGMADLGEIEEAVGILEGAGTSRREITILHCNTEYPTPMEDVNLLAMQSIAHAFKVDVGYSDHTLGIEVPIAAVALGARCIEKHFTISREMEGPDHKASLEPSELIAMVRAIRNIEVALGDGIKRPSASEVKNKEIARKSIHLASAKPSGYVLKDEDLVMKRPGDGIPSALGKLVVGKRITRDLEADYKLNFSDLI